MKACHLSLFVQVLVILCTLSATTLSAQKTTYRTVKVKGAVNIAATGKRLHKDRKFTSADALVFGSANDLLVVIDDKSAAFMLRPDASLRKYQVKPLNININTRPGHILTDLQLRQFFDQNDSLLLLDGRFSLVLGREAFPMDERHFFYLQYLWKGDTINKKLGFRGDTLVMDEREVYKVDGVPINPAEVSGASFIRYFVAETNESVAYPDLVRPIYIVKVPEDELMQEILILLKRSTEQDRKDAFLRADNYLAQYYGRAGETDLRNWLVKMGL